MVVDNLRPEPTGLFGNWVAAKHIWNQNLPSVTSGFDGPLDTAAPTEWTESDWWRTMRYEVHLKAGDALYIPSCWWHFVRGGPALNTALAFNFVPHDVKSPRTPIPLSKKIGEKTKVYQTKAVR